MDRKRILVTGGMGVLGRMLVPRLRELGFQVIIVGNKKKWPESISCDIRDRKQVYSIFTKYKPDTIIHLAGITGNLECETNVQDAILTNIVGTYNILESNRKNRAKIIFASTREVYMETPKLLEETSVIGPKNINGITKMFAEKLVRDFYPKYNMSFIILRFSNFFGENNEKKGISVMIKNAIQKNKVVVFGGKQEVDLLHYNDAINAILKSLEYHKSDTFNIAGGNSIKVVEIIKKLEIVLEEKIKIMYKPQREFESTYCRLNIDKANKYLKFRAKENIDTILEKMISRWTKV